MTHTASQLFTALAGSLGFCLLFQMRPKLVLPASLGSFFSWGIYLLCSVSLEGIFLPTLLAAAFCALYAEILARIFKTPATLFFVAALIPLIPGSSLYYTMSCAVQSDWHTAGTYGFQTAQYALGIAAGASLVWAFHDIIRSFLERVRKTEK